MPVCDLLYLYVDDRAKGNALSFTQHDWEVINSQGSWSGKGRHVRGDWGSKGEEDVVLGSELGC